MQASRAAQRTAKGRRCSNLRVAVSRFNSSRHCTVSIAQIIVIFQLFRPGLMSRSYSFHISPTIEHSEIAWHHRQSHVRIYTTKCFPPPMRRIKISVKSAGLKQMRAFALLVSSRCALCSTRTSSVQASCKQPLLEEMLEVSLWRRYCFDTAAVVVALQQQRGSSRRFAVAEDLATRTS